MLPVTTARSSSDGNAMRYVLVHVWKLRHVTIPIPASWPGDFSPDETRRP